MALIAVSGSLYSQKPNPFGLPESRLNTSLFVAGTPEGGKIRQEISKNHKYEGGRVCSASLDLFTFIYLYLYLFHFYE